MFLIVSIDCIKTRTITTGQKGEIRAIYPHVTIASRCLHGRRYAEFVRNEFWLQWLNCDDRFAFATHKRKYTSVGRQCAHRDVGMQNLSGTKFGRNGVKCYNRFAFATHKRKYTSVGRQCVAMASNVTIASRSPPTSEIYSFGTSMCPQVMLRNNITQMETLLP